MILDKYHDEDDGLDAPPSYDTISGAQPTPFADKKSSRPQSASSAGTSCPSSSTNPSSSWIPKSMLSFSSRPAKQVRQTILALVRDLVLNPESPNFLSSCADACRNYSLDLSSLLQEPCIEHHSAIYWAVLNRRDALLPSLLAHATPLSQETISEIRLACLASANQVLFQSLRCQREPFTREMTPLSTSPGADALLLGSMPADDVSIREVDGQGEFVADVRINLWQKRMRVSGRVSVEFIARGRIWSLTFFSPPATCNYATTGVWQVALCLLEHSPPTFIDSRLVIGPPPVSPLSENTSPASDLILLSSPSDDPSGRALRSPPPPSSPTLSNKLKLKSKGPQTIEVRLKSTHRLAYRASNPFSAALDAAFLRQKDWNPPNVEYWDKDATYTNAIVVPLTDGNGGELLFDNTPFITTDGALRVRLEARLAKPDSTECVIC